MTPPELDQGNITQSSARLRPPPWMPSEYLRLALLSPILTRQYDKLRFGNAVQRLNVEHVRRLAVPISPAGECAQVVAAATGALRRIPTKAVATVSARLQQLDAGLLAKAFRGELVPQDPNDEPAADLLARIASERDGTATPKSNGRLAQEPSPPPSPARRSKRTPTKSNA